MDLLDVNLWLALADQNHRHHHAAQHYWTNQSHKKIAFCRITALGFLRLSTHPKVLSRPLTTTEAWNAYQNYRDQLGVVFIEDSTALDLEFRRHTQLEKCTQPLWTDAYLAALAQHRACRLVSFDADFHTFDGLDFLHLTETQA